MKPITRHASSFVQRRIGSSGGLHHSVSHTSDQSSCQTPRVSSNLLNTITKEAARTRSEPEVSTALGECWVM